MHKLRPPRVSGILIKNDRNSALRFSVSRNQKVPFLIPRLGHDLSDFLRNRSVWALRSGAQTAEGRLIIWPPFGRPKNRWSPLTVGNEWKSPSAIFTICETIQNTKGYVLVVSKTQFLFFQNLQPSHKFWNLKFQFSLRENCKFSLLKNNATALFLTTWEMDIRFYFLLFWNLVLQRQISKFFKILKIFKIWKISIFYNRLAPPARDMFVNLKNFQIFEKIFKNSDPPWPGIFIKFLNFFIKFQTRDGLEV